MQPDPQRLIDRHEFPVLYVDDEQQNLRAFELMFRREFRVLTAQSGRAALELINEHPVAVVLSDHRMPEMTGTEFLARVRSLDDRTVRLLVTAYGDAETLADAVNNGNIYRYVAKPWAPEEMRLALSQAIDLYALESERESLVGELTSLRAVSRGLSGELDLERLSQLVAEAVVNDFGFDAATVMIRLADADRLKVTAALPSAGSASDFLRDREISVESCGPAFGSILEGRTELIRPERSPEFAPAFRELLTEVAADEQLVIPLVAGGRNRGLLLVDNRRGGRNFGASETSLLEGLAAQAAVALENALVVSGLRSSPGEYELSRKLSALGGATLVRRDGPTLGAMVDDLVDDVLEDNWGGDRADVRSCLDLAVAALRGHAEQVGAEVSIEIGGTSGKSLDDSCSALGGDGTHSE